jgi:xanthine dehydrogenase large subunit
MIHADAYGHVTGSTRFIDDIPLIAGTLHAVPFVSPIASGSITAIRFDEALLVPGVVNVLTWSDIPGCNQIGNILSDEELLASGEVHYRGQPVALVIAENESAARKAVNRIRMDAKEKVPVTDPRQAMQSGSLILPPRTFQHGNTENAWSRCTHIFSGSAESGAQEHLYLETQAAYAIPVEDRLLIHSSTQAPSIVQKTVARVLDISMHRVEIDTLRLGGAFGGKEDQATPWATLAALAAYVLHKPVKLVLSRHDDLYLTGKRHPYSSDFRIGLSDTLEILAYEVTFFQNAGAAADLSPPVLERSLFHATGSYYIPNVKATAYSCRTNLPPNTAFRGFGAPQAMFVIESAICLAATKLGVSPALIQEKNLIKSGETFYYGQRAENNHAGECWSTLQERFGFTEHVKAIEQYNLAGGWFRKGCALMPVCFGISFTKTPMNQAYALVHIYQDGSIGISTGAVEMGQGVNTKLKQVASTIFSVDPEYVRIESTNTARVANASPTAASSGADLNGKALEKACSVLANRLKEFASGVLKVTPGELSFSAGQLMLNGKPSGESWKSLVARAFENRIKLTEAGHYATPGIHFDRTIEKGSPFAYHVCGTALVTATVDCLRGRYRIDEVKVVHDFGNSMNPLIDLGQVEGGIVQGIGWMTLEEVRYDETGKLLSNSLSNYKIPDIGATPRTIECIPLETMGPEMAILRSKAIGEPPFMYGIAAFFAIRNAILAFNPEADVPFVAPLTPERVLISLYSTAIRS